MLNELTDYLEELQTITHGFTPIPTINTEEYYEIYETVLLLVDSYMYDNIYMMSNPLFHTILYDEIYDILYIQCIHIINNDKSELELSNIIISAISDYFTNITPKRSYDKTFCRKTNTKSSILTNRLQYLRDVPQPSQRTTEWYKFRYNLLTASTAWKGLDTLANKNSIIYEKCQPLNVNKYNFVNTASPCHHGTIFEPISIAIYEHKYNTTIEDFGCIKDEKYTFLGASPDGININPKCSRYARMLEVKNIVNRDITGIPKKEYWIQMQIQMNVCKLNDCDFLETKITEYNDIDAFNADGNFKKSSDGKMKGIFIYYIKDGKPYYEYPPIGLSRKAFHQWEATIMKKNALLTWNKNIYWKLDVYSCVLVLRNKIWFDYAVKQLSEIWTIIKKERVTGYEHRAPKRSNKVKALYSQIKPFNGCLISINDTGNTTLNSVDTNKLESSIIKISTDTTVESNL